VDWLGQTLQDQTIAEKLRMHLRETGRVHVPTFLSQATAEGLFEAMQTVDWRVLCRGMTTTFEATVDSFAALDGVSQAQLFSGLYGAAATGFQYLYDVMRISDKVEAGELTDNPLATIYLQLNSRAGIDALRKLTGDDRIAYVDARATRYRTGHFLTTHDDSEAGKQRLYGYVLNLTPKWRADWGGLLMFFSPDGHVSEAFTPAWNAINIFSVPQPHAVSMVTPYARANRYSITGWLRSQRP
jgi:SM-20-related protein